LTARNQDFEWDISKQSSLPESGFRASHPDAVKLAKGRTAVARVSELEARVATLAKQLDDANVLILEFEEENLELKAKLKSRGKA
jgi:hypothetical protein